MVDDIQILIYCGKRSNQSIKNALLIEKNVRQRPCDVPSYLYLKGVVFTKESKL
jgi:hypothetical protein